MRRRLRREALLGALALVLVACAAEDRTAGAPTSPPALTATATARWAAVGEAQCLTLGRLVSEALELGFTSEQIVDQLIETTNYTEDEIAEYLDLCAAVISR